MENLSVEFYFPVSLALFLYLFQAPAAGKEVMEIQVAVHQMVIITVSQKACRSIKPDSIGDGQADAMHGEEASSQKGHAEYAGPFPVSDVLQPFDGSDLESTSQFQRSHELLSQIFFFFEET